MHLLNTSGVTWESQLQRTKAMIYISTIVQHVFKDSILYVCYYKKAKMAYCSEICISTLKCFNLENKAISYPICKLIIIEHGQC